LVLALGVVTVIASAPVTGARTAPGRGTAVASVAAVLAADPSCTSEPYRARRFDVQALAWSDLYPSRRSSTSAARPPLDAQGVPMVRAGDGKRYYSPSGLTFEGLRRLNAWVVKGDPADLELVQRIADRLRLIAEEQDGVIWLPFLYDKPGQQVTAPWYNALAQGTALALFSRLHRLLGRSEDLVFARGLFTSLAAFRDGTGPWVAWLDSGRYAWYEHYPAGKRGKILNAHLYVIVGLRDYWQQEPTPEARCLLEGAITTMRDRAQHYRVPGSWSYYALRNKVAYKHYHRFHIGQLRAVGRASGDAWFTELAALFVEDFDPG